MEEWLCKGVDRDELVGEWQLKRSRQKEKWGKIHAIWGGREDSVRVELSWVRIFVCGAELAVQSQRRRTMVHAWRKSWVFSRRLKVLSDSSGARSEGGRLFQVVGPNTAKLRWPVEVRTLGKRRVPVVAERNWRFPSTEVTRMHCAGSAVRAQFEQVLAECSMPVKWQLVMHGCPRLTVKWGRWRVLACWKNRRSGDPGCLCQLHISVYSTMQCFSSLLCTIMITLKLTGIKMDRRFKTSHVMARVRVNKPSCD